MRILGLILAIVPMACAAFAQEPAKPSLKFLQLTPGFKPPPPTSRLIASNKPLPTILSGDPASSNCSVRLLQAEIPGNVDYIIGTLHAPDDPEKILKAQMPAPPCEPTRTR